MYLGLFNKKHTHSQTNSGRIATPVSGFLLGKCHAAPSMPCVGSIVPTIYLCVSHTEALLMVSNTSYHKRLHGLHRFTYHILALFATCKRLAVLKYDLKHEGSIFLCFKIVYLICYGESLFVKDLLDIRIIRPFKQTRCSGNMISTLR
jgi:hypothetical protein